MAYTNQRKTLVELRSRVMRAVKPSDTTPELVVRRILRAGGFHYRLHRADLPGNRLGPTVSARAHARGMSRGKQEAGERQAGCDFPVPTFALPRNVTFSLTTSRGASISPRSVQPAWSSQRSVTKILPSTVPCTSTDFVLISPRMHACSPIVSVPVDSIVPSTSPSMSSSFRNLTEPLIETPWERRAPDCVGMDMRLNGRGTTDGSG